MEALNHELGNELLQMAEIDRTMREKFIKDGAEWDSSSDNENQSRLKEIIEELGWPTVPKVGVDASNAAWLIAQHAPDLQFMQQCLGLMENLSVEEINPANIAYLKDRVLILNGKPQIYGTQFQGFGKDMHVYPIEDVEHVDKRRASVGLSSFADNEKRLRELYKADN